MPTDSHSRRAEVEALRPDWAAIERLATTNRPRMADREALYGLGDIPGEEWSEREMAEFVLRVRALPAATPSPDAGIDVERLARAIHDLMPEDHAVGDVGADSMTTWRNCVGWQDHEGYAGALLALAGAPAGDAK